MTRAQGRSSGLKSSRIVLVRPRLIGLGLVGLGLAGFCPFGGMVRPALGQVRDARIPEGGELWVEFAPSFENWSQQFAEDSPVPGIGDGEREPLFADYEGSVADRLFPGIDPLLAAVNEDAAALGFEPLGPGDVALGALDFRTINVDVRRVPFALQLGLLDRIALEAVVPFVFTEVESFFIFDSAGATLISASSALPDPDLFFGALDAARAGLQAQVDEGGLTPEQEAAARALLESSGAFASELTARAASGGLLPAGGTAAGDQVAAHYDALQSGFGSFGLELPAFTLPALATSQDLAAYLRSSALAGSPLGVVERGLTLGEIELGARLQVLDGFPEPVAEPDTVGRRAAPGETGAGRGQAGAGETDAGGIHFRTTIAAKLRLPTAAPDLSPNLVPGNFLQQPVGDGQRDLELALYQDIGFGSRFLLLTSVRYGIQMADRLDRRVHSPDRPFATAATLASVERDLGDYLDIRIAPQFRLDEVLAVGVEYGYWHKQADSYTLTGGAPGAGTPPIASAAPLEIETSGTRQRLGIGAFYRTTREPGGTSLPLEVAFIFQTAIAGAGGQTPASQLVTASLRVPLDLF